MLGDENTLEIATKGAMDVHTKKGIKSVQEIYYPPQLKKFINC